MKEDKNLRILKEILKKIKENKTFKQLKVRGIDGSYLIYPNFSKNIYNLIIDSKINLFGRVFLTNFLKHMRNLRVKIKKNSKLTQKDILYIIFNKREFHEEISKFLKVMDKKNTNLIIREPYFKEFGAFKLIPKDIDYSFFNSHIDSKIKKQWRKEKRKLYFYYKKLINDLEFRRIFISNEKNRWKEAKIILKNFFLEELYWSALIILITEKIIKIAKPKIFINSNCFSYCTREVALTMKKEGVKVVNIAECIMDFDKKFLEIIFNAKGLFKNHIDYFLSWGERDKKKVEKSCFVKIIGSTKQPPLKFLKNISKKKIVGIVLSTHSELENKRKRLKIIRILKNVINNNPSYKFIMKLHPSGKEKRTWYKDLEKLNNFSITKNKNLYSLLSKSKYIIVEGSTVGSEATIFDTEVIVLTINPYALCDYTDHPIYFKTNTAEKINKILNNKLSRSKKYKKSFIEEFLYKIDGKTHLRIKKEIDILLKSL